MSVKEFHIKKKHTTAVWTVALALTLALLLGLFWLSPMIWNVSDTSKNVIPLLYSGDRQIVTHNSMHYIEQQENPGLEAKDKDVAWEVKTDVDLFSPSYIGEDGSVTVESSNGDKVIAPGTGQEYHFSLKNTGNVSLDYTMELASLFTLESQKLPIEVRLRKGNAWIIGDEVEWKKPDSMENVIEKETLGVNRSSEYVFEWRWPFEVEIEDSVLLNDINDIIAANAAVSQDVKFQLEISTVSTVTEGARPVDENGNTVYEPLVRWNIFVYAIIPALILLLTVPFIVALLVPVYVSGRAPIPGQMIYIREKSYKVRVDGRFVFKKVPIGKSEIILGKYRTTVRIKRKFNLSGLRIEDGKKGQVITMGTNVRAIELYFLISGNSLSVDNKRWTAVDNGNQVFVPQGRVLPKKNGNTTPGGLVISPNGDINVKSRKKKRNIRDVSGK